MKNSAIADESTPRYILPLFILLMLAMAAGAILAGQPQNPADPSAYVLTKS
jgi:hypothetical protein